MEHFCEPLLLAVACGSGLMVTTVAVGFALGTEVVERLRCHARLEDVRVLQSATERRLRALAARSVSLQDGTA